MNDREILVPEVEGKTIRFMRLMLTSSAETEIQIDFTDGTSFSSSTCPRTDFEAELYIGGVGEPQILKRYGNDYQDSGSRCYAVSVLARHWR